MYIWFTCEFNFLFLNTNFKVFGLIELWTNYTKNTRVLLKTQYEVACICLKELHLPSTKKKKN